MTPIHRHRLSIGCALFAALSACASPRATLYTLEPTTALSSTEGRASVILVGPVVIPQLVDRPQLVVRDGEYKVKILEQQRWASPLKEALPRLLAGALNQRIPDRRFVTASSPAIAAAGGRIAVDISRFEATRGGAARIVAHWVYRAAGAQAAPVEGDEDVQIKATDTNYESVVRALQSASLGLADEIAKHIAAQRI